MASEVGAAAAATPLVFLSPVEPSYPVSRLMLDQYAEDMRPYQPDPTKAFERGPDDHVLWPALLGPGREKGLQMIWIQNGVPEEQPGVVGFMNMRLWELGWEVRDLFIIPEKRRQGYGRAVIEQLQRHVRDHNEGGIVCDVFRANEAAQWFFTKLGFERLGASTRWGVDALDTVQVLGWPRGYFHITKTS